MKARPESNAALNKRLGAILRAKGEKPMGPKARIKADFAASKRKAQVQS